MWIRWAGVAASKVTWILAGSFRGCLLSTFIVTAGLFISPKAHLPENYDIDYPGTWHTQDNLSAWSILMSSSRSSAIFPLSYSTLPFHELSAV